MGIINIDPKTFFVASIFYLIIIIILLIRVNSVLRRKIIDDYKRDLRSIRHSIAHNLFAIALKDIGNDAIKKEKLNQIIDDFEREYASSDNPNFDRTVLKTMEMIEADIDLHTLASSWVRGLDHITCVWNVSREVRHKYSQACLFNKELDILGS